MQEYLRAVKFDLAKSGTLAPQPEGRSDSKKIWQESFSIKLRCHSLHNQIVKEPLKTGSPAEANSPLLSRHMSGIEAAICSINPGHENKSDSTYPAKCSAKWKP